MTFEPRSITAKSLSGGVFISALTPFAGNGDVLLNQVTAQAKFLGGIPGVRGIAVSKVAREREVLSVAERCAILNATRQGLNKGQLLLACIGELANDALEYVRQFKEAGADVVVSLASEGARNLPCQDRTAHWLRLTENLALPVIVALNKHGPSVNEEITSLAEECSQILGFELGAGDDVVQYDREYYAVKAANRYVTVLSSSQGALFHNLNTGGDGVLSCLAFVVPHEVVALYEATREGRFYDDQAIHTKLAPLVAQLSSVDVVKREQLLREASYHRRILAETFTRSSMEPLSNDLKDRVIKTLDDMRLKPVEA